MKSPKIKLAEIKSLLLELINENMFGHRFKISFDGKEYPALISKNVAHNERHEGEYRITWFDPNTMKPYPNHIAFGVDTLNYILRNKKFPMAISLKYMKLGLPVPKIIVDKIANKSTPTLTGVEILVGTIDPDDDFIEAKFGGTHTSLQCRTNRKGDFRYNEDTEIVYWHEDHPPDYEKLVNEYIRNKLNLKVIRHITLSRYRGNPIAYTLYHNDAHGIEQPEDYSV